MKTKEEKNQLKRIPLLLMILVAIIDLCLEFYSGSKKEIIIFSDVVGMNAYHLPPISRFWDILGIVIFGLIGVELYQYTKKKINSKDAPLNNFWIGISVMFIFFLELLIDFTAYSSLLIVVTIAVILVFFVAMSKNNTYRYNIFLSILTGWVIGFLVGVPLGFLIGIIISFITFTIFSVASCVGLSIGLSFSWLFSVRLPIFFKSKLEIVVLSIGRYLKGK